MNARVLVVDDQDYNRELIGRLLVIKNFDVLYAENAKQAIATATAEIPDVILMDIGLPDMDGIEATKLLGQNVSTSEIPVIAVTAHTDLPEEDNQEGCFYDYVTKPIDFSVLISVINSAINRNSSILSE